MLDALAKVFDLEILDQDGQGLVVKHKPGITKYRSFDEIDSGYVHWNPLRNWSDFGPLIVQFRISLEPVNGSGWKARYNDVVVIESTPGRAVCKVLYKADEFHKLVD